MVHHHIQRTMKWCAIIYSAPLNGCTGSGCGRIWLERNGLCKARGSGAQRALLFARSDAMDASSGSPPVKRARPAEQATPVPASAIALAVTTQFNGAPLN